MTYSVKKLILLLCHALPILSAFLRDRTGVRINNITLPVLLTIAARPSKFSDISHAQPHSNRGLRDAHTVNVLRRFRQKGLIEKRPTDGKYVLTAAGKLLVKDMFELLENQVDAML